MYFDDYNDLILDPEGKPRHAIIRPEATKSILYVELVNRTVELGIFSKILDAVKEAKIGIEIIADLIGFIAIVQPTFNRRFASNYLG